MKHVYVISVPHSGTNTIEKCMFKAGFTRTRLHTMEWTWKQIKDRLRKQGLNKSSLVVCPLRHPMDVWGSWQRRIRTWDWELSWTQLQMSIDLYKPVIIPVDIPGLRESRFESVGAIYDGEVENKSDLPVPDIPMPCEFVDMLNGLPVVQEHYGKIG